MAASLFCNTHIISRTQYFHGTLIQKVLVKPADSYWSFRVSSGASPASSPAAVRTHTGMAVATQTPAPSLCPGCLSARQVPSPGLSQPSLTYVAFLHLLETTKFIFCDSSSSRNPLLPRSPPDSVEEVTLNSPFGYGVLPSFWALCAFRELHPSGQDGRGHVQLGGRACDGRQTAGRGGRGPSTRQPSSPKAVTSQLACSLGTGVTQAGRALSRLREFSVSYKQLAGHLTDRLDSGLT